jgi:Ca-activated chloride channel family protein
MAYSSQTESTRSRTIRYRLRLIASLAGFLLSGAVAATTLAQSPSPTPVPMADDDRADVVRVETTLVNIPVTVMNRQGRYVPNLRLEDFHVYEDGVEQRIAYFAEVEKPLVVALVLDTSASTKYRLEDIRAAAIAFIDQLRPDDRVMVVSFNDWVDVLAEPTNDHQVLRAAVSRAKSGNSTHLYDAVDFVLNQRLNKISGRKAVVLLTDGVDFVSQESRTSTLHAAEETEATICSVQYDTFFDQTDVTLFGGEVIKKTSRLYPPGLGQEDYQRATTYLTDLATKSGGEFYHAADLQNIKRAFARIAEQLRSQYSLGYYPTKSTPEEQQRTIKVQVDRNNLVVRARRSYIYKPPEPNGNPRP